MTAWSVTAPVTVTKLAAFGGAVRVYAPAMAYAPTAPAGDPVTLTTSDGATFAASVTEVDALAGTVTVAVA